MTLKFLFIVVGLAISALVPPAAADDYPSKPIYIINPAPPGGGTDIVLRIFAEKMSQDWGQQVLIMSRPGARGMLAANDVAKSEPNGYKLLGTFDAIAINPALGEKLPYDTIKDFAPISLISTLDMGLFVASALPVDNLQQLIAYAKAHPGELTYASVGKGSSQYLVGELLKQQAGINIRHIPYTDRAAISTDVMTGRTSIMISSITGVQQLVKSGALKALGVTGAERSPVLPEVPTLKEAGLPNYEYSSWVGLFAPAGTPKAIIDKVNAEVQKIAKMPDVRKRIDKLGSDVKTGTPEALSELLKSDISKWTKLFSKVKD